MDVVMKFLTVPLFALAVLAAPAAQARDSLFKDYNAFSNYIDREVKRRNWVPMIQKLGGRSRYTQQQLQGIKIQFDTLYRQDFTHVEVFNRRDLGGGLWEEGRIYWRDVDSNVFVYLLLHEREEGLVVIRFSLNSSPEKILSQF
jgi:hypothetical protein